MKKINKEDVVTLSCFVLLFILGFITGYFQGDKNGFDKGVKVTAVYADSVYKESLNQCDSITKEAIFYVKLYKAKCDSLNHKSK